MSALIPPPTLADDLPRDRLVGITTTVPVEVILAAGRVPVDLNNVFLTAEHPGALAERAEHAGFPRTCCCWTKGIYGAVHEFAVPLVVGVSRGDCSNAEALLEVLQHEGVDTLSFNYPAAQDEAEMQRALGAFASALGADLQQAEQWRRRLQPHRAAAAQIDRLSWQEGRVHGLENHLWLVSTSDFGSRPLRYLEGARAFLEAARSRPPLPHTLRIGLCGVPPIAPELYDFCEGFGALVVFNETSRQFAMPNGGESLAEQYTRYTYPYGIRPRLDDIREQIERRCLDGLIHYVQSFCHRRIEDRIVRDGVHVPVLTLEADRPGPLSGQIQTRLEAFLQMLAARRSGRRLL